MAKLVILFLTVISVYYVAALSCYNCLGALDKDCNDPFTPKDDWKTKCDGKEVCAKSVDSASGNITRGCSPKQDIKYCESDNCNSADSHAATILMVVIPAICSLFLGKHNL